MAAGLRNRIRFLGPTSNFQFAAGLGFEPRLMDSESTCLPLADPAIYAYFTMFRFNVRYWYNQFVMKQIKITDAQKITHDTLLSELHNIDDLAERHTQVVLFISAALIAYSSLKQPDQIIIIAILGALVSLEWMLKVLRYRQIFRSVHDRLSTLEQQMGVNALRPLNKPHKKLFSFDGLTMLLWFASFILLFWAVMLIRNI